MVAAVDTLRYKWVCLPPATPGTTNAALICQVEDQLYDGFLIALVLGDLEISYIHTYEGTTKRDERQRETKRDGSLGTATKRQERETTGLLEEKEIEREIKGTEERREEKRREEKRDTPHLQRHRAC